MNTKAETGDTLPQNQGGNQILKSCPLTSSPTDLPQYSFKKTQAVATERKRTIIHHTALNIEINIENLCLSDGNIV